MAYAVGKHSLAQCDRCGFVYKYLQMKMEWNGLKVCPVCYEPKQPQLRPANVPADPEALRQPMDVSHNDVIGSSFYMEELTGSVGTVTVTTG